MNTEENSPPFRKTCLDKRELSLSLNPSTLNAKPCNITPKAENTKEKKESLALKLLISQNKLRKCERAI